MCMPSPVMTAPSFVTDFVVSTPIHAGTVAGAAARPGEAVQPLPLGWTKPLKLAGAAPPLSVFASHQDGLQNVTCPLADLSPTAKTPPAGRRYSRAGEDVEAAW